VWLLAQTAPHQHASAPEVDQTSSSKAVTREKGAPGDAAAARQVPSPASRASPSPEAGQRIRYVTGHRVAFRAEPSRDGVILDRFDTGRALQLLKDDGAWSHVMDPLTQRSGWISSRLLAETAPRTRTDDQEKPQPRKEVPAQKPPAITDATVIARIIAGSIGAYPGNCPCPYSRDRAGRSCGQRSAYSKPGGYSPICYPADVTGAMIEAFRKAM
jgi:hypothetical protein